MRGSTLGLALLLAGTAHAAAADLSPAIVKAPVAAPASWTGVYVGLGLGSRTSMVDASLASAIDAAIVAGPSVFGLAYKF